MPQRPLSEASRNERAKLRATSLNAIGFAVAAVGVIQPIFNGSFTGGAVGRVAASALIAYVFHWVASGFLNRLED